MKYKVQIRISPLTSPANSKLTYIRRVWYDWEVNLCHRLGGPAIEYIGGGKSWIEHGNMIKWT